MPISLPWLLHRHPLCLRPDLRQYRTLRNAHPTRPRSAFEQRHRLSRPEVDRFQPALLLLMLIRCRSSAFHMYYEDMSGSLISHALPCGGPPCTLPLCLSCSRRSSAPFSGAQVGGRCPRRIANCATGAAATGLLAPSSGQRGQRTQWACSRLETGHLLALTAAVGHLADDGREPRLAPRARLERDGDLLVSAACFRGGAGLK